MSELPDRALSIRQPWAWAIVNGGKDIENRTWETLRRGRICIHAAKGMTNREWDEAIAFMDQAIPLPLAANMGRRRSAMQSVEAQRGGIIATAEIVDCVRRHPSPWFSGPFGIVLANIEPVDFISVSGALGFFDWRKRLI